MARKVPLKEWLNKGNTIAELQRLCKGRKISHVGLSKMVKTRRNIYIEQKRDYVQLTEEKVVVPFPTEE